MRGIKVAIVAVVAFVVAGASPTLAVPADGTVIGRAADTARLVEDVHCRPYRHWHWWGHGYGCGPYGRYGYHHRWYGYHHHRHFFWQGGHRGFHIGHRGGMHIGHGGHGGMHIGHGGHGGHRH